MCISFNSIYFRDFRIK